MVDFTFVPLWKSKVTKIFSSFNNARKSNVGIGSSEIMKKAYRRYSMDKLSSKIESKNTKISELQTSISDLTEERQNKIDESLLVSNSMTQKMNQADSIEEKQRINQELIDKNAKINRGISDISRKIRMDEKDLQKAKKELSALEEVREEKSIQSIRSIANQPLYDSNPDLDEELQEILNQDMNHQGSDLENQSQSDKPATDHQDEVSQEDPLVALTNAFHTFIEQITQERETYKIELDMSKRQVEEFKDQADEATKISQEIEKEAQMKIQQANATIRSEKQEIGKLREQVNGLKKENGELRQENSQLTEDNNRLHAENNNLKKEKDSLASEVESLKNKTDELTDELKKVQTQFSSIKQVITSFSAGMNEATNQDAIGSVESHSPYVNKPQ